MLDSEQFIILDISQVVFPLKYQVHISFSFSLNFILFLFIFKSN